MPARDVTDSQQQDRYPALINLGCGVGVWTHADRNMPPGKATGMFALSARDHRIIRAVGTLAILVALLGPLPSVYGQAAAPSTQSAANISRVGLRVTSGPTARTVSALVYALDSSGQAISDLNPTALRATLDGRPIDLSLVAGRPTIALATGFLLDSSASPQVRDTLANALAEGIQGIDINRDSVAIVSSADARPWEQATFSTSADELKNALNQLIQTDPSDSMASLEQVSGILKALGTQQKDARALLLFTNRPLASAASVNASLGTIRSFAVENGIQISIVALAGAGGQGPAEALAEATPGGRVEYALNATNKPDLVRRIAAVLAPAFGLRRVEFLAPNEGTHALAVGSVGAAMQASANFVVSGHAVPIDLLETSSGALKAGAEVREATWVLARPAENVPIDNVEWTLDGRVTQAASEPFALLLDPEQLGDGRHELTARIISQGRAGPFLTSSVVVPSDFLRIVRNAVRAWGLVGLLLIANAIVLVLFLRVAPRGQGPGQVTEFPPTLRLNQLAGAYVAPEMIHFPTQGKLRIGYHPPYMDNQVGSREFSKLPYQDIRGDEEAVKDISRHVACIWRDPKTNDCYIQLGWPGPGEPLKPKQQSQVFHFGRPQDATSEPFRLAHHDVLRLGTGVEFVFYQVGLRDKATPEGKKLSPFESRSASPTKVAFLAEGSRQPTANPETLAEEG
jgi:hypothetical protein